MSEPNPYEAPRAELSSSPAPARPITVREQAWARRMLEARRRGGYTVGLFYRWSALRYLFVFVYFGAILAFLAMVEGWALFMLTLGLLLGVLLRDLGSARATAVIWPFSERVTEWDKVRRIAEGEPLE